MKKEQYHVTLDKYDQKIVINALNTLKNNQVIEERPTNLIDDLIIKVANATTKKARVAPKERNEER